MKSLKKRINKILLIVKKILIIYFLVLCNNRGYVIMEYKKITQNNNFLSNQMKLSIILFSFFVLTWQAITISNTIAERLEQRTEYINFILSEYMENN